MKREGPTGNAAVRIVRARHPKARCESAADSRSWNVRDGGTVLGTAHTSIDAWANAARNILGD